VKEALCGPAPQLGALIASHELSTLHSVTLEHAPRPGTQTALPLRVEVRCD